MNNPTATVIGSGPNGLSAAIVLAAAGIPTTVFEKNSQLGGGRGISGRRLQPLSPPVGTMAVGAWGGGVFGESFGVFC